MVVGIYTIFILGLYLRRNTVLKELWLAHNDLTSCDARNISTVLKANLHLQFLDISNNNIEVSMAIPLCNRRFYVKIFSFKLN